MLAVVFVVTAMVGLFVSNSATAVLIGPIAIDAAQTLHVSPYAFAMTVSIACCAAYEPNKNFATEYDRLPGARIWRPSNAVGRVPISIKINGAVISRVSPSARESSGVFGALRASPLSRSRSSPCTAVITALEVIASALDLTLFAFAHGLQIDGNGASVYTVKSPTPCQIGDARAGDHRFGGSTADVNTDTTELAALDQRHFLARLREGYWEESAALTGQISFCFLLNSAKPSWATFNSTGASGISFFTYARPPLKKKET
jgi:hypothetical protein